MSQCYDEDTKDEANPHGCCSDRVRKSADVGSTNLLSIHPRLSHLPAERLQTRTDELIPFFAAQRPGSSVLCLGSPVVEFWTDAHKLSCLKRNRLRCTVADVANDFRTEGDGFVSLSVSDALDAASSERIESSGVIGNPERENHVYHLKVVRIRREDAEKTKPWNDAALRVGARLRFLRSSTSDGMHTPATSTTVADDAVIATTRRTITGLVYTTAGYVAGAARISASLAGGLFSAIGLTGEGSDPSDAKELDEIRRQMEDESRIVLKYNDEDDAEDEKSRADSNVVGGKHEDFVISSDLSIICCRMILDHVRIRAEELQVEGEWSYDLCAGDKILLHRCLRNGKDPRQSFLGFCREAGSRCIDEGVINDRDTDEDLGIRAEAGSLLSKLDTDDASFLEKVLMVSNHAAVEQPLCSDTNNDGGIIGIFKNPLSGVQSDDHVLSEADTSIFRLCEARDVLEARMKQLSDMSTNAGKAAVLAKRKGAAKSAVLYQMKKRALALQEMDRCGNALLNVEHTLEGLRGVAGDIVVLEGLASARDALRMAYAIKGEDGEEGKLTAEAVDDIGLDLQDLMALQHSILGVRVGGPLVSAAAVTAGGPDIDEAELERELEALGVDPIVDPDPVLEAEVMECSTKRNSELAIDSAGAKLFTKNDVENESGVRTIGNTGPATEAVIF